MKGCDNIDAMLALVKNGSLQRRDFRLSSRNLEDPRQAGSVRSCSKVKGHGRTALLPLVWASNWIFRLGPDESRRKARAE